MNKQLKSPNQDLLTKINKQIDDYILRVRESAYDEGLDVARNIDFTNSMYNLTKNMFEYVKAHESDDNIATFKHFSNLMLDEAQALYLPTDKKFQALADYLNNHKQPNMSKINNLIKDMSKVNG